MAKWTIGFVVAALIVGYIGGQSSVRSINDITKLIQYEAGHAEGRLAALEIQCGADYAAEWDRRRSRALLQPFAALVGEATE